jgi:NAD(P)H-hydrate epimerase
MRRAEAEFVETGGDLAWLMRQAGMQVASRIPSDRRTIVLVGPGNNGGDGLATATLLKERADDVFVYTYKREPPLDLPSTSSESDQDLEELRRHLERADIVVDCLLGIGRRRPVENSLANIIEMVNQAQSAWRVGESPQSISRIAVDVPTGVDTDSGAVATVAFRADTTISLGLGKRGLFGSPGADYAGEIEIADIGLSPGAGHDAGCFLLDQGDTASRLPSRSRDWNKGRSGRVLVIGGSRAYPGAPSLVSVAAYRVGAGLVEVAVPADIKLAVAGQAPEVIFAPVAAEGHFAPANVEGLATAVKQAQVVAVGPGLGSDPGTVDFVRGLLPVLGESGTPTVLDADGLNAVADWDEWWRHAPTETVITPHPGEMARLVHRSVVEVQSDRFGCAADAARRWGVVVVLKGSNSIIALPSGKSFVNPTGGPNLGVAGTGDVLTGTIAGLLAQGLTAEAAATAGTWIHGTAGDAVRGRLGDAGTIASDLWAELPLAIRRFRT